MKRIPHTGVPQGHHPPIPRRCRSQATAARKKTLDTRPLSWMLLLMTAPLAAVEAQVRGDARADRSGPGIVGVVVDRVTDRPLEAAAVALELLTEGGDTLPAPVPVVTDAAGRFVFEGIADGRYRIEIDLIGYRTMVDSVDYRAALGLRMDVQMVEDAVELEPLFVVAEARSLHLESTGFYDRRWRGIGRFLVREELLAGSALRITDVLRTLPGVRLRRGGSGPLEDVVVLRGGCLADVYVDGVPLAPPVPVDALLSPTDLDGLEVYHASELPAGFRTTRCGAVVLWTHAPNPGTVGDPFTWRRALVVATFVGLALFLTR